MKRLLLALLLLSLTVSPAFAKIQFWKNKADKTNENVTKQPSEYFEKSEITNQAKYKIYAVDPKKEITNKDALVIYTPLFGKTTGTDKKALEAVILNNRVTKINQYNSYIPQDGYVISGHGKAKEFISNNLFAGADVEIDFAKSNFNVITSTTNYLYEAAYRLDNMKKLLNDSSIESADKAKMKFYINCSEELLDKTKKLIQFTDYERAPQMAKHSMAYSDMALFFSLPYKKDEFKAVWVFPYQKNENEIFQGVDNIINRIEVDNIFVESFYNGMTVYNSEVSKKYGIPEQNRYYKGNDILKVWLQTGENLRKNIYVSFNTFNIGNPEKSVIENNIVSIHPTWQNKTKEIVKGKKLLQGDLYLDPANPEVRKFILDFMEEISEKYNIAGIDLKGLRYPAGDYGYTDYARTEFTKLYGVDPITLAADDERWQNYKLGKINEFVNEVVKFQKNHPKLTVFINVYPDDTGYENWQLNGNIALCPVLTSSDDDFAADFINKVSGNLTTSLIFPIYMDPYLEEPVRKLFDQITVARKSGANGIILYTMDYLDRSYLDALRYSIFNKPKEKQKHLYEKENKNKKVKEVN